MQSFLVAYGEAYKAKYGSPPEGVRDPAIIGKIGHRIKNTSAEHAILLIQIYLQINYKAINESQHDLWQFFRNLNRIGNAFHTGKDVDSIDWSKVFGGASG